MPKPKSGQKKKIAWPVIMPTLTDTENPAPFPVPALAPAPAPTADEGPDEPPVSSSPMALEGLAQESDSQHPAKRQKKQL